MNKKPHNKKSGRPRGHRTSVLRFAVLFVTAFWLSAASILPGSTSADNKASARQPKGDIAAVAIDAYIYGYPLVLSEYTRQRTPPPSSDYAFYHMRKLATPLDKGVVRPNNDTLFSSAYLNLAAGPIVLHVPDIPVEPKRYYLMQIMDAWTNVFAHPSTVNTGGAAQDFIICGPDWCEPLPRPMQVFRSPTNLVWIIARTQVLGEADLDATHAIQDAYRLTPLSEWPGPSATVSSSTPAAPMPPPDQVAALTGVEFFGALAGLMGANPAAPWDMPALKRFEAIGFVRGEFNPPAELVGEINAAPALARAQIAEHWHSLGDAIGEEVNGWQFMVSGMGTYGTDYLTRAAVAMGGLGANLPEDAVYPTTECLPPVGDEEGEKLNGKFSYMIYFPAAPPTVDGFWSITLYDDHSYLVANSEERYAIHNTDPLVLNDDGSFYIYLQKDKPSDPAQAANWLPTPDPAVYPNPLFNLTIRIYAPETSVLKGRWEPPPVQKVDNPLP